VGAGQFRDHGGESGAKAGSVFLRHYGLVRPSALRACALKKNKVGHIQLDFGQLDDLVRVVGLKSLRISTTAAARAWIKLQDVRRWQYGLPMPCVPDFCSRTFFALGSVFDRSQRRICEGRLVRIRGIYAHLGFKLINALSTLGQFNNQIDEQPQHRLRGIRQVLGRDLEIGREIWRKCEHTSLSADSRKNLDPVIAYVAGILILKFLSEKGNVHRQSGAKLELAMGDGYEPIPQSSPTALRRIAWTGDSIGLSFMTTGDV